jgi:hypothetical protein
MNIRIASRAFTRVKGGAAVEMALCLPVLVVLLAAPLFFARVCWHYTVAEKAAHDAARFLAAAPTVEMTTQGPGSESSAATVARWIAATEISELNPGPLRPSITIQCDGVTCDGLTVPLKVSAIIRMRVYDPAFYAITSEFTGGGAPLLTAAVTIPYVGN